MRKTIRVDPDAIYFIVINQDTGEVINRVTSADDEEGWYCQIKMDENGKIVVEDEDIIIEKKYGNIKLIDIYNGKGDTYERK